MKSDNKVAAARREWAALWPIIRKLACCGVETYTTRQLALIEAASWRAFLAGRMGR